MSSSSPHDLPGKLPKSSLISVDDVNKAIDADIQIKQILDSINNSEQEILTIAARLTGITGLRMRKEALKRKVMRLQTAFRRRREQICKKLIHDKIREARRDLGIVIPDEPK